MSIGQPRGDTGAEMAQKLNGSAHSRGRRGRYAQELRRREWISHRWETETRRRQALRIKLNEGLRANNNEELFEFKS